MRAWVRSVGYIASLLAFAGGSGCAVSAEPGGWDDADYIGQATFEIKAVPATGVSCIRISVVGGTTVTKDFGTLAPNAGTTSLNMDRLPVGNVTVSAMAYSASTSGTVCNTSSAPTWIADPASALLEPGVVSKLDLTFRKNNPVTASANFVGNIQALEVADQATLLLVDGQVYQWGENGQGSSATPTPIPGMTSVVDIGVGHEFACAVKANGTMWCWGFNTLVLVSPTPIQVATAQTYTRIEVGEETICGIAGHSAYCWGSNYLGELGVAEPTSVPHTSLVTSVNADLVILDLGLEHTCYVAKNLDIRCVGSNDYGQLGRTTSAAFTTSWGAASDVPVLDLALGADLTVVALADGTVRTAGRNNVGQLGIGNTTSGSNTSTQLNAVSGLTNVQAVAAGDRHALALRTDGSVRAWGANATGQLGDNTNVDRLSPVTVATLPPARLIGAGEQHSCAVTQDERVFCWGGNGAGQLGTGDTVSAVGPKQILLP
jgi:alpha-tubulin suppressor-like RCC1 family protein